MNIAKHTMQELYQWQALPLNIKVLMTAERIRNWVNEFGEDGVYLSFSAGKDSTVLGHIIREICGYKNIPFVFVDVPTQYPELKEFAKTFEYSLSKWAGYFKYGSFNVLWQSRWLFICGL